MKKIASSSGRAVDISLQVMGPNPMRSFFLRNFYNSYCDKTDVYIGGINMIKRFNLLVLNDEKNVDEITKIAANYNLTCTYKVGIYGKEKQHELYICGNYLKYIKFIGELRPGMYKCRF